MGISTHSVASPVRAQSAGDGCRCRRHAHDEALLPGLFAVVLQPGGDVLDDLVRLHVGTKKPAKVPGLPKGPAIRSEEHAEGQLDVVAADLRLLSVELHVVQDVC